MNIIEETSSYLVINNYNKLINKSINNSIIGFDLDNTIIKFNLKSSHCELMYKNTIDKLKEINKTSHIIIITNQKKLKDKNYYILFTTKIQSLLDTFTKNNIFVDIYASSDNDNYRKPCTGLYDLIYNKYNKYLKYYCGDAVGRPGDFSDTDYKFALNNNIKIVTPEHIFLDQENILGNIKYPKLNITYYNFNFEPKNKEMIIMCGYPASGKSYISQRIVERGYLDYKYYVIINRDTLVTVNKCIKVCERALINNFNVVIDNTNPDIKTRKIYIDLAKKYNYKIRLINMITSYDESLHNNHYRSIKYNRTLIPTIAYNCYKSKYEKPSTQEDIDEIIDCGINIYDIDYNKYYF